MQKKVLVTDPLAPIGLDILRGSYQVDVRLKPSEDELRAMIGDYDALIVRSGTQVTSRVLEGARRLAVIGRAGTGVDNIDVEAATRHGIVVVNTPTGNTVAVAEHAFSLMLCLARHICEANMSTHAGRWEKRQFMGSELRNKTLGVVGLGNIGTALAIRARGFEMRIVAYDPYISPQKAERLGVEMVDLDTLLTRSDYISLHAPTTQRTCGMIGAHEFDLMGPETRLINCARGDLVVEKDLITALQTGQIAGAALDVYDNEPHVNEELRNCPNIVLTPHLGASTQEAQSVAAEQVARQVVLVLKGRPARYPVNVPPISGKEMTVLQPYLDLAESIGRLFIQMGSGNVSQLEVSYAGDVTSQNTRWITAALLAGIMADTSELPVNLVNARTIAQERDIEIAEVRTTQSRDFAELITLRATNQTSERVLSGTVLRDAPHIVRVDDYWIDFVPEGRLLVSVHTEQPGVIGQVGTLLGETGVNISFVQVGREGRGGCGLMVLGIDDAVSDATIAQVKQLPSTRSAHLVTLPIRVAQ